MLLIVFGTRPEWLKVRPVVKAIDGKIPYKLLYVGQHTDLIDVTLENYNHENLIIKNGDSNNRLDAIVCSVLNGIDDHLQGITHLMVVGDTTTVFAAALACFHRKIKVIHLEAGLRTFNKRHPYPEEFNRQVVGSIADIHLCPTELAVKNLLFENKDYDSEVRLVGNTVLDNLVGQKVSDGQDVLITLHRRENQDQIEEWFKTINKLAKEHQNLHFILPMHPNPSIIQYKHLLTDVKVSDPLPHHQLLQILKRCKLVITDSGGIQEEAAFFRKPCIVCRKTTERSEGLNEFSWLCEHPSMLPEKFDQLKDKKIDSSLPCPYGDGNASDKILRILNEIL